MREPVQPTGGGLLNRKWVYVPAASTDIRKTFALVLREQKKEQK